MNAYNDKGLNHGLWTGHYSNGNLMYKQNYINGDRHGLSELHGLQEVYYSNGNLNFKTYYL